MRIERRRQLLQRRNVLALQGAKKFLLTRTVEASVPCERGENADMTQIQLNTPDPCLTQRSKHQPLHLDVAFKAGVAVDFCTHQQRLAGVSEIGRQRMQYAPD